MVTDERSVPESIRNNRDIVNFVFVLPLLKRKNGIFRVM